MIKSAVISECGTYRYELWRVWNECAGVVTWCMLNPSTADAEQDDPTVRKCIGFARLWGYGGIKIVNLFALRATNPKALRAHHDPVGPLNNKIVGGVGDMSKIVVAWGGSIPNTKEADSQARIVRAQARREGVIMHCLGTTKAGEPRHPLMLAYKTPLERWR